MNDADAVRTLVADGVDAKSRALCGDTALHVALAHGQAEAAVALLDAGADVNARGAVQTPLSVAAACAPETLVQRLLEKGADVRYRDPAGHTALHFAAIIGRHAVAELLIAGGADVNARTVAGATPLHLAALKGSPAIVTLLVGHGARVDAESVNGTTPLGFAIVGGSEGTVRALVRHGANVNAEYRGVRILWMVAEIGHPSIAAALIEHGALADEAERAPVTNAASRAETVQRRRLSPEAIQGVVRSRQPSMEVCYGAGLVKDSKLEGRVRIRFKIEPAGSVPSVEVQETTLPEAVSSCIAKVFKALRFPPTVEAQTVVYPIDFERDTEDPQSVQSNAESIGMLKRSMSKPPSDACPATCWRG